MACIFLPDSIDFSPKNRYTIPRVLCVVPNAQRAQGGIAMHDSPGSVVTQLCSGLQLYSAERRIADCILADVKWASVATLCGACKGQSLVRSHGHPAVPQARLRKLSQIPTGACAGCSGAAGNGGPQKAPQRPAASGPARSSEQPSGGGSGHHSGLEPCPAEKSAGHSAGGRDH